MGGTEVTRGPRRILIWVGNFEPGYRGGGPIRSIAEILNSAPGDARVTLVTRDRDLGSTRPFEGLSGRWVNRGRHRLFYLNVHDPRQWSGLLRALRAREFETVYVNSFWSPLFGLLPVIATRLKVIRARGLLVAPRGEMSAGAMSLKSRKKRLAMKLWRPWFSHGETAWHATSAEEVQEIASLFPGADVRLIPDELSLAKPLAPAPAHPGPLRLVFISRISPKKNLLGLIEALSMVQGEVTLDIYGPIDDGDYWARCEEAMLALPATIRGRYRGELTHDQVAGTFQRYDAFCLPTLGENFGHVIAESLASSCPVLCTDRTPWTAVLQSGGGAVIPSPKPTDIAGTIQEWAALGSADRYGRRIEAGQAFGRWSDSREAVTLLDRIRPPATAAGTPEPPRIALLTQGFDMGGGVPEVARWLRDGLREAGYGVDHHDVATSRRDPVSRRLLSPPTWLLGSLRGSGTADGVVRWGANWVELEPMRYRPRRELTKALDHYDLVQVVSGGPALGRVTERVSAPVVLETATRASWERASQFNRTPWAVRLWRMGMTRLVEHSELRALAAADAVVVANQELGHALAPCTGARVLVAAHGVDTRRFRPHPDGLQQSGPILSVCRLNDPRKGLERVLEAYAVVKRRMRDAPGLILAGKGAVPPSVSEAIIRLGLSGDVVIMTDVPGDDLPGLYRHASVYVQASYEEGFGLAVAEAMASGLPVVCTDTAGTRETVVDGDTGWLIRQEPKFSAVVMADAIGAALGSEGRSRGLAGLARCRALFSHDVTIRKVTSLYDDLLGEVAPE